MADVCLILEGTYPYVTGGVSHWVHNLIKSLHQVRFSILAILPSSETYKEFRYDVPENVVSISRVYIHEYEIGEKKNNGNTSDIYDVLKEFHNKILEKNTDLFPEIYKKFISPETRIISPYEQFFGKKTWEMLQDKYTEKKMTDSFIDYFWTWRYSHLPIFRLFDAEIPQAKIYHTISTGYAGLMSVLAYLKTGKPIILTEHGIYTNERRIEIEQANWIYEQNVDRPVITQTTSPFKQAWIHIFEMMSRLTYNYASEIITLFDNNRKIQIQEGAKPEKCRIIPNGIDLSRFSVMRAYDKTDAPPHIGFVGRVVPIKDVKTFLMACKIIKDKIPNVRISIIGPTDEDEEYFAECKDMAHVLSLDESLTFTGRADVSKIYPDIDVVVLTSISEAQPLVILEANCCGVPCVTTDVGACRELINGRTPDDVLLGPGGLVTPIAQAGETAAAVIKILKDKNLQKSMGCAGKKRVERFYNEKDLNFAYLELYRKYLQTPAS